MKSKVSAYVAAALLSLIAVAVFAESDIDAHRDCVHCGMDRKAFGYSRMLVQYEDGASVGLCSLRCAAVELEANKNHKVKAVFVADRDTRTLINVEKAVWVLGGNKKGVMTMLPKWAFESRDAADKFLKEYGGKIASWSEALEAARKELSQ
jgi:copper chaperone NosL